MSPAARPDPPAAGVTGRAVAVCGDVGSTYTKLLAVELGTGALAATAEHRTTVDTDVLVGYDACLAALADQLPGADLSAQYVCSSAGGGLRLAVVGYEPLVTADAGHRVGLSAGARVVHVAAGPLDGAGVRALRAAKPDVVLLVGGTDGGDAEVLTHNAARLAGTRLRVPVVVAGNADAADAVRQRLADAGVPVSVTDNVLPRIGQLNPAPARAAIRRVFLSHVIGGKKLSAGARFPRLVRAATPDAVLAGVELLADGAGEVPGAGEILAVDVGGATPDVYSVLVPDA
ncbi:glutamate mutase L, partial [Actinocatenispora thailandica]|uniref:glutamate mutase L n=1 Tax=Actinocatenispora thailandica TaxID=227318 RepID=UPI0031D248C1